MLDRLDDTIVAISTSPGKGQRGVVRLSGPASVEIALVMFQPHDGVHLGAPARNRRVTGRVGLGKDEFLLPAELFIFRAPRSYTRQEVVEFHTAGAPAVLALVMDHTITLGARPAEAGEFTARAFFNGALDLAEVEGVAALIQARSDGQLRAAQQWLEGRLALEIKSVQQELVDLVSLVEADIDFADEPIDFIQPKLANEKIEIIAGRLEALLQESQAAEKVEYLPRVMLVGAPNSGKSTLMNALSGMNRAVCSPIAGTTRDFLTAVVSLPGGEFELMDTAGIGQKSEKVEKFTKIFLDREMSHVHLVCHLLDLTESAIEGQVLPAVRSFDGPVLWVANKADKVSQSAVQIAQRRFAEQFESTLYIISATRQQGFTALKQALDRALFAKAYHVGDQRIATNARHREALLGTVGALRRAQQWCRRNTNMIDCAEWVALDLRAALNELGVIFGEVTTDQLLDRIFSGFCIGK